MTFATLNNLFVVVVHESAIWAELSSKGSSLLYMPSARAACLGLENPHPRWLTYVVGKPVLAFSDFLTVQCLGYKSPKRQEIDSFQFLKTLALCHFYCQAITKPKFKGRAQIFHLSIGRDSRILGAMFQNFLSECLNHSSR